MSVLYEEIRNAICQDSEIDKAVFVIDETENTITVEINDVQFEDGTSAFCHRYTVTDTDVINLKWLDKKLVISNRIQYLDRNKLLHWLQTAIEPEMLMTLECILVIADNSEEEYDALIEQDARIHNALIEDSRDLPRDGLVGIEWFTANIPVVNLGAIESVVPSFEVNEAFLATLAHEIRHLAQSNDYLPADVLCQKQDNEADAEAYGWSVIERSFPSVWKKKRGGTYG